MNSKPIHTTTVQELYSQWQAGNPIELIDVRAPLTFAEAHVPFARSIPFEELDSGTILSARANPDAPMYVICQIGKRSMQACEKLAAAGGQKIVNVQGGTQAWREAGLPLISGKVRVSLFRQVQIGAGAIVLTGVVLGYFVHPVFFLLSGFIGAGLIFAGATNICGMAMLLAKMPWNRKPVEPVAPPPGVLAAEKH